MDMFKEDDCESEGSLAEGNDDDDDDDEPENIFHTESPRLAALLDAKSPQARQLTTNTLKNTEEPRKTQNHLFLMNVPGILFFNLEPNLHQMGYGTP